MNGLKVAVLMALLFGIAMLVGGMLGGQNGLTMGFIVALVMNLIMYRFSDRLALAMSHAQPISEADDPQLYRMVERLARNAGIPTPRLYLIPSPQPNAFATGHNPENGVVAVSAGLLEMMDQREIEGVIAHELAHIRNRDILVATIAATFAGMLTWIIQIAQFNMIFGGRDEDGEGMNPLAMLAVMIIAPLAATLIQLAISRSREFDADRGGAEITGDPMGLASALRKIEWAVQRIPMPVNAAQSHMYIMNPLAGHGGTMMRLFSTHPETSERIRRLEAMAANQGQLRWR